MSKNKIFNTYYKLLPYILLIGTVDIIIFTRKLLFAYGTVVAVALSVCLFVALLLLSVQLYLSKIWARRVVLYFLDIYCAATAAILFYTAVFNSSLVSRPIFTVKALCLLFFGFGILALTDKQSVEYYNQLSSNKKK